MTEFSSTTELLPSIGFIKYKPNAKADESLYFKHYNADEIVHGRSMKDWFRFSVCWWHTFHGLGNDMFGVGTQQRAWDDGTLTMDNYKRKIRVAFEFFQKLGVQYYSYHDRDLAPEGATLKETNRNLDEATDLVKQLQDKTGIRPLVACVNMFTHPRFMNGAATNPDAHVYAIAGAQVRKALELAKKLDAQTFVLWGGREGYQTLLNTDLKMELTNYAAFLKMVVAYKEKIGFKGQLLIEPKPKEPTKHQYDYDVMTAIGFLKTFDLDKHYKLNIEPNHTTLAGHGYEHDLAMASAFGMLGSIDANTGSPDVGWDTDQFPMDVKNTTVMMKIILEQNGLQPGGLNLDCKLRRESTDLEDMFIAHIGAMDTFARCLKNAAKLIEDGLFREFIQDRYKTFKTGFGHKLHSGLATLDECEEYAHAHGEPEKVSGKQEHLENVFNYYI